MARRVNTQFLTILLVIVAGAGAALLIAQKFLIHDHADPYILAGKQAMKDQKWYDATGAFSQAAKLSPADPQIELELGQAWSHLEQSDPDASAREGAAFSSALQINPKFLPALRAMIKWDTDQAQQYMASGNPVAIGRANDDYLQAIDYARRAYELDPKDKSLAAVPDKLIIQKWIGGLETDQTVVDKAIKDLSVLSQNDPSDAEIPLMLAKAKLEQGGTLTIQSGSQVPPPEATQLYQEALDIFAKIFSGPNGGPQDGNAMMHYDYAQVLEMLSLLDQSSPEKIKSYREQATAQMSRAQDLTKQQDPIYFEITEGAAQMALHHGDRAAAIHIYRSMPDSLFKTLHLAPALGATDDSRPEAEQLLASTVASLHDDPARLVPGGPRFMLMMAQANLWLSDYGESKDPAKKKTLHDQIGSTVHKLDTAVPRDWLPLIEVESRFQVITGGQEEQVAVSTLGRILSQNATARKSPQIQKLMALFAQALWDTNQLSRAVPVLTELVNMHPDNVAERKYLVAALLRESPDLVQPHLDVLEKQDANDPDLLRYHIELLKSDPIKNHDAIQKYYQQLPESTPREMDIKAMVALGDLNDLDETRRLLEILVSKDKKNADDFVLLAKVLVNAGDKAKALEVAQQGLAANPDNDELKILIPAIKGEDPKIIQDLKKQMAQDNPDHTQGELQLADMAAQRGDTDAEETHLKAAEKWSPKNPLIWERLFNLYLSGNRYSEAAAYIPKLAGANYDSAGGEMYRLVLAKARGDMADALAIARKLTQDKPDFPQAWLALGDVLLAEREYQQAIVQYQVCLEKQSNMVGAYAGMVQCFYALRQPGDALHTIDLGLTKVPADRTLHQLKLLHELNYGDPHEAIDEIKKEIMQDADHRPDLYAAMGDVALKYAQMLRAANDENAAIKQSQEAANSLTAAVGKWPDDPTLYTALANAELSARQPQAALQALQQWANRPQWRMSPDPHVGLANFYERINQPDTAEQEMRTALARSDYRVDLLVDMATMLNRHKKYDDALSLLRAAGGNKPAVRTTIVQTLLIAGKFDEAQAELKSDMAGHPTDAEQLLTLWAEALLNRRDFAGSVDRATAALKENPKNRAALYCRARAELELNTPQAAATALQDLIAVRLSSPNDPDIRMYVAQADVELNRLDDAASELESGLRIEPMNKPLRMKLVEIYMHGAHPRLAEALQTLQEVDSTAPFDKDPEIFQTEAVILEGLNRVDEAVAPIRKAASLAPNDPSMQRAYLQLLLETRNFQKVLDQAATFNDKLKNASWTLWACGRAEKELDNPAALPDMKAALTAALSENQEIEFDHIVSSIADGFGSDEAIADVAALGKDHVVAQLTLARLYDAKGDQADQQHALDIADSLMGALDKMTKTDQFNTLHTAAMLYQSTDPPLVDKAYAAYQRWLALSPDNPEALNNLACLLADDYTPTRAAEGLPYAQRTVDEMNKIGQVQAGVLDTQAWLLILTGSPREGVNVLNKAMADFDTFPYEYLHLGEGYYRMNLPEDAKKYANLGLSQINSTSSKTQVSEKQNAELLHKLQDLINKSDAKIKASNQAQVP